MALISLRQLLDHAAENDYGIPAFNVNNMEQMLAIMKAAHDTDSLVIMQASSGARKFANDIVLRHLIEAAIEMYPHIPVCMHQDHGNSPQTCLSALMNGFSSVMMDGSLEADGKTPSDFDYNAGVTAKVAEMAHLVGASIEGEIGHIGPLVTNPDEAEAFAKATNVDALAVAIGTSHGAYKFTRKPDGEILAMDAIKKIHARLPNTHLVMHGSSSVPKELQDIINEYGGGNRSDLGGARRRDRIGDQARRAQDQRRYRLTARDDQCRSQTALD